MMLTTLWIGAVLGQSLSADTPVIALETLLAKVSTTGVRLVADGPIGTDLVAVRMDKMPMDAFMKRLADATLGTWAPIEGGFRLTRDSAKWSAAGKDESSKRLKGIADAITKVALPTQQNPKFTADSARKLGEELRTASSKLSANPQTADIDWAALQGRSPGDRLLARALLSLDPAELANMADGERKVWSSRPNRLQRPLGPGVQNALAQFVEESRIWQSNKPEGLEIDALGSFGIAAHWATGPVKPTRLLLIASTWTTQGFVNIELKLLDDAGQEVTGTSTSFNIHSLPGKEDALPPAEGDEAQFELSKLSMVLRGLKTRTATEAPAEVRKALLNPEGGDAYLQAGIEAAAALAGTKPFVAVFTDTMVPALDTIPAQATASTVRSLLERSGQVRIVDSEDGLTLAPAQPVSGRALTLSRATFGTMLRQMEQRGGPSLDHLRELSRSSQCLSPILSSWLRALHPESTSAQGLGNWDLVRLYDALVPSLGPEPEQSFEVGRMNEAVRGNLGRLVYYSVFANIAVGLDAQTEEGADPAATNPTSEPTEVWPNGIPGDLVLSVNRAQGKVLAGIGADHEPMDAQELGAQLAMRERPDVFPWMSEMPLAAKFAVLEREQVSIMLAMKPGQWLAQFTLADLRRTDGSTYAMGGLPGELQKAIDAARGEARKLYGTIAIPGRGGNIPPLTWP